MPKPAKAAKAKPRPKPKAVAKPIKKTPVKVAAPKPATRTVKAAGGVASRDTDGDADLSIAGQIYRGGKLTDGVLHIDTRTGRIVRVAKSTTLATHHDFGTAAILPGAIDLHVHFREPGHTHKEDLTTGSVSAAFGGVTGFVDMPNTLPATTTLRALKDKLALAAQKSVVDYAAWAGGSWYTGDLPEMLKLAAGVKTYLGATTGDLLLEDMARFQAIVQAAGAAGRPVALHAESQRVLQQLRRNEASLQEHDMFRPPMAEVEAIYDAMKAVATTKKPPQIHIAHTASAEAVEAARTAKFSLGVCPHHLLLDTNVPLTHAYGKMNPPLRGPAARKQLWDLFAAGRIPILESDHAPHTGIEKEDNFHAAPSGVPGVETMVPLMMAQAKAGKVDLKVVVDAATRNPAQLLGLDDRGSLEPGLRADFAVYDMKTVKVEAKKLHAKCGWTPFEGHNAIFPSHTFLAGRAVVEDHDLVAAPGTGKPMVVR
ncbi:MAG: dihydroorotase [Thermoplasmata archaeon]|jgi:dihydroorotase|nr:dihydroorotase [Thermoplasmata archaeon]